MHEIAWIGADWGTTNLRIWTLDANDDVVHSAASDDGMGKLAPAQFEEALLNLVEDFLPADRQTLVVACGMVGARQGWIEAPYLSVPGKPGSKTTRAPTADDRLRVEILPGMSQAQPGDVIRGEETQALGFLNENPGFDGVLCLPGTHTKWLRVKDGAIAEFQSYMTGELFHAVGQHTVLKHSVDRTEWDDAAFDDAVKSVVAQKSDISRELFRIRAAGLLDGVANAASTARLSGLLLGTEISSARSFWEDAREVHILGDRKLSERYERALMLADQKATVHDADHFTLAGLKAAAVSLASNGATTEP